MLPRFRFLVTSRRFCIWRYLDCCSFCPGIASKHLTTGSGWVTGSKAIGSVSGLGSKILIRFHISLEGFEALVLWWCAGASKCLLEYNVLSARYYAERGYEIACRLSVRPSVTFRYRDHIGWNSSTIISRPNSLRFLRSLTPTGRFGARRTPPKLGWGREQINDKSCKISETVQDRTEVTMTD